MKQSYNHHNDSIDHFSKHTIHACFLPPSTTHHKRKWGDGVVCCWLREIIVDNCVHGLIMLHSHLTWQPKYLSECELLHCIKCQASAGGAALELLMLWESRMRENLELESWCHESMGDLILSFQVTRVKWHIAGYQIISCITQHDEETVQPCCSELNHSENNEYVWLKERAKLPIV